MHYCSLDILLRHSFNESTLNVLGTVESVNILLSLIQMSECLANFIDGVAVPVAPTLHSLVMGGLHTNNINGCYAIGIQYSNPSKFTW